MSRYHTIVTRHHEVTCLDNLTWNAHGNPLQHLAYMTAVAVKGCITRNKGAEKNVACMGARLWTTHFLHPEG